MGCGCNNKNKKNKPSLRGNLPRMQFPPQPIPAETPKAMIDLPSPPQVSNAAAARRIKQLNQQAVMRSLGK